VFKIGAVKSWAACLWCPSGVPVVTLRPGGRKGSAGFSKSQPPSLSLFDQALGDVLLCVLCEAWIGALGSKPQDEDRRLPCGSEEGLLKLTKHRPRPCALSVCEQALGSVQAPVPVSFLCVNRPLAVAQCR